MLDMFQVENGKWKVERTRVLLSATSTLGRDNAKHSLQRPLYRLETPNRLLYGDASARSGDLFGGLVVHNTRIAPSFLAKVPNILRSTVCITLALYCRSFTTYVVVRGQ